VFQFCGRANRTAEARMGHCSGMTPERMIQLAG
jgi:hypothetical protein